MAETEKIRGCNLNVQNPCKLYDCLTNVKGFSSNSASPTDTWLLNFAKNTTYKARKNPEVEVEQAFLKLFISPKSLEKISDDMPEVVEKTIDNLYGLEYERRFYTWVVKPILDNNISPHFIRIYNSSNNCTFSDLINFINPYVKDASNNLLRNILFMLFQKKNRPSISNSSKSASTPAPYIKDVIMEELGYSFILTQYNDPKLTKSLDDFFNLHDKDESFMLKLSIILFQVAQGCFALHSSGSIHNDLHIGNILVTDRPCSGVNVKYVILDSDREGERLELTFKNINVCARIYDFDRSYAKILNNNRSLDGVFCEIAGLCNQAVEGKDILNTISIISKATGKSDWALALLKDSNDEWLDMIMEDTITEYQPISANEIEERINTYPVILKNFYNIYKKYGGESWGPDDNGSVYVCPSSVPLDMPIPDYI